MKPTTSRLDLNASSADRWTTCTASPHFILENWDKVPARDDTSWNTEGVTAHEVAEAMLQDREPDLDKCPTPITGEMRLHGFEYMDYVLSLMKPGGRLIVEQKLPLWYMPGRHARIDAGIVNPDILHIVDYKYGEGIPVSPEGNKQLVIYAQSVIANGDFKLMADDFPVHIHVVQPRGRDGSGGVWETTWGEVAAIAAEIHQTALWIQDGMNAHSDFSYTFAPSDKACQWCPAKGFCTARQQSLADGLEIVDSQRPVAPTTLSEEQLTRLLRHKAGIVSWLNDVEQWAEDFLKSGGKIPGFKLVLSRGGNRKWSDERAAKKLLLSETVLTTQEVVEEKIIGPAAAEKILGKNKFSAELTNLIVKSPGVPVIAPVEDKREAIGDASGDFEVLT